MLLHKYLPSQYAEAFLRGEVLFRNLSYFKKVDCQHRGDATEGIHRDRPDTGVTIENLSVGGALHGDYTYLNEIDSDLVFVFCVSEVFDKALFHAFDADCCIEISNPDEFAKRVRRAVMSLASTNKDVGLLQAPVQYYDPSMNAGFDINKPTNIAFVKDERYEDQKEFRFVFGKGRQSFRVKEAIVISNLYDYQKEVESGTAVDQKLLIGNIEDIARIHPKSPCFKGAR